MDADLILRALARLTRPTVPRHDLGLRPPGLRQNLHQPLGRATGRILLQSVMNLNHLRIKPLRQGLGRLRRQIKKKIHPQREIGRMDDGNVMRRLPNQSLLRLRMPGRPADIGGLDRPRLLQHGLRGGTMTEIHHHLRLGDRLGKVIPVVGLSH